MKYSSSALAIASALALITTLSPAEARSIRTDISCPFGSGSGGGSGVIPATASPYSPGVAGFKDSATVTLGAGSTDQFGGASVSFFDSSATMWNYYSLAIPNATNCPGVGKDPFAQVIEYKGVTGQDMGSFTTSNALGNSLTLSLSGGTDVQFNYSDTATTYKSGSASFTMGGLTFTALNLPTTTLNDFIFDGSGLFLGAFQTLSDGTEYFEQTPSQVTGWSIQSAAAAPEINSSSAASALTLLFGCLAVLRGGSRRPLRRVD